MQATETTTPTGPDPIPQMFPELHIVMEHRLPACLAGAGGNEADHESPVRTRDELRSGSAPVSGWIADIRKIWSQGAASTLHLARLMCVIRNQSLRGQWSALWRSGQMPFARRKGYMLAAIGTRLGWANVQTFAHLPIGWSILHQLAHLDRQTLENLIQQGTVHPKLTLRQAKELVAEFSGKQRNAEQRKGNVRERLRRFVEFVHRTADQWEPGERESATETLTQLVEEIGVAGTAVSKRARTTDHVIHL